MILGAYVILREMESRKKINFPTRYFGPPVKLVDFFRGPKLLEEDQPSNYESEVVGSVNQSFENSEKEGADSINQNTYKCNDQLTRIQFQGKHNSWKFDLKYLICALFADGKNGMDEVSCSCPPDDQSDQDLEV